MEAVAKERETVQPRFSVHGAQFGPGSPFGSGLGFAQVALQSGSATSF